VNPTNTSNWDFVLSSLSLSEITQYSMLIKQVQLDNVSHSITAYNNTIKWYETDNGGNDYTLTATLTSQTYTGAQLASHLGTVMTAESLANGLADTYTGSYNSQTKCITIANAGIPNEFWFLTVALDSYSVLGITSSDLTASGGTTHTFSSFVNLSGARYIDILSNALSTSNISTNSTASVICRVPLTAEIGSVVYYQNDGSDWLTLRNDNLSQIDISLRDDHGNPYEIDELHPLSMSIEFKFGRV
jgi:hypothetical protein